MKKDLPIDLDLELDDEFIDEFCDIEGDEEEPTESPKKIVTMLIKAFCIVSDNLSTTPLSLHKLPNVNAPIKGQASGKKIIHNPNTTSGNTIFSLFDTSLSCDI